MTKLTKVNTGNQDNSFVGCAITGSCDSLASAYVKTVELSDGDVVSDGMIVVITFNNGNTAGNAPSTKTIYSSDQVNYYEDAGLTVPFTLAPDGCYDLEYTGTGNAYTYQSYPVLSIGDVTGPVCDYRGHKASGSLWEGGDEVQCMYKNGKFLLLGGSSASMGAPIGTIISTYKKIQPKNYLYCDGSFFDENQYPALYLYLGSNQLPDYRECVQVGAEQNTTDTIASHDVYTQGQFKDDQLQDHSHKVTMSDLSDFGLNGSGGDAMYWNAQGGAHSSLSISPIASTLVSGRSGSTTHGKQKAVYYYIKAVDGVDISDEDTFLNTVKDYVDVKNSYSTDEVLTGGTWIDGKPIYRKTLELTLPSSGTSGTIADLSGLNIDTVVNQIAVIFNSTNDFIVMSGSYNFDTDAVCFFIRKTNNILYYNRINASFVLGAPMKFTVEYTKTTD